MVQGEVWLSAAGRAPWEPRVSDRPEHAPKPMWAVALDQMRDADGGMRQDKTVILYSEVAHAFVKHYLAMSGRLAALEEATARLAFTSCREWDEELSRFCGGEAEFVLWGKLFPAEGLGPRCYLHAAKHAGHRLPGDPAAAIIDLRPLQRAFREAAPAGGVEGTCAEPGAQGASHTEDGQERAGRDAVTEGAGPRMETPGQEVGLTAGAALENAIEWATGRRSHLNVMMEVEGLVEHRPQTLAACAQADAAEVVKWAALAQALGYSIEQARAADG